MGHGAEYVGSGACGTCHVKHFESQSKSHHARALRPIGGTPLADLLAGQTMRDRSGAAYQYRKAEGGVIVSITKDSESRQMLLEWCFGAGSKGYTPVGRDGPAYVEHRISWYRQNGRLGLTAGHSPGVPPDLESGLGIAQSSETITRCFRCHATGVGDGPVLSGMEAGVTCERCHGPGSDHVTAAQSGKAPAKTIFNPRGLSSAAQKVQVCSQCHRSPNAEYPSLMPELDDPASIRFAPVGFQASACFRQSKTFSCVTCHDPHSDPRPAADPAYTAVCLTCHRDSPRRGSACKRALKVSCVQCHMKTATPLSNLTFTDHRIRVYLDE